MVSPMPSLSRMPKAVALLIVPWNAGPRLGDAEVQRPVPLLGQQPVRLHHHDRVVVLDRDLEVVEVVLLEQARLPDRALDEGLRGRLAVLLQQAGLERAGVHTDPDGNPGRLRGCRDRADLIVELPDVARIHAHGTHPGVDRGEHVPWLEMDVRDDRDLALHRDDLERVGVVLVGYGDSDDVASGGGELGDLLEGRVDVRGLGRRHRLDADLGVTADRDFADMDLPGLAPRMQHLGGLGHPKIHGWHGSTLRAGAGVLAVGSAINADQSTLIGLTMSA